MNYFLIFLFTEKGEEESKMNGEFGNGKGFRSESFRQKNLKLKFQVSIFYRFFWRELY